MDSNDDGIGDILGLYSKLTYIKSLGVDIILLSPITEARKAPPGCLRTRDQYNGYECVDLKALDPELGTLDDLVRLVERADELDLKLIIDLVTLGVSTQHPFFRDVVSNPHSVYRDHFFIRDQQPCGSWLNFGSSPWNSLPWGGYYYSLWLDFPYFNYANPALQEYMLSVATYWLQFGIAGFRVDGAKYVCQNGPGVAHQEHQRETLDYWRRFRRHVTQSNGDSPILIAEIIPYPTDVDYIGHDREMFDFVYDGVFAEGLFSPASFTLESVDAALLSGAFSGITYRHKLQYMSNHDRGRLNRKIVYLTSSKEKLVASLHLLSNGVPLIYYGEEIGLTGGLVIPPHLQAVSTMAWEATANGGFTNGSNCSLALSADTELHNVASQESAAGSLLNHYRALIRLRRSCSVFAGGSRHSIRSPDSRIYAYFLYDQSSVVLVVHNISGSTVNGALDLSPYVDSEAYTIIFGQNNFDASLDNGKLSIVGMWPWASAVVTFDQADAGRFFAVDKTLSDLPFPLSPFFIGRFYKTSHWGRLGPFDSIRVVYAYSRVLLSSRGSRRLRVLSPVASRKGRLPTILPRHTVLQHRC